MERIKYDLLKYDLSLPEPFFLFTSLCPYPTNPTQPIHLPKFSSRPPLLLLLPLSLISFGFLFIFWLIYCFLFLATEPSYWTVRAFLMLQQPTKPIKREKILKKQKKQLNLNLSLHIIIIVICPTTKLLTFVALKS